MIYVLKRLLAMIPTLLGITLLTFLIIKLAPGDPVEMQMGPAEGGGAGEGGGGGGNEAKVRMAEAIRAKKKLLGLMEPEHTLRAWTPQTTAPAADPSLPGSPVTLHRLPRETSVGAFEAWVRSIAPVPGGSRAFAGLEDGRTVAVDLSSGDLDDGFRAPVFGARTDADGRATSGGSGGTGVPVWSAATTADGGLVAVADGTGRIRLLDGRSGAQKAEADVGRGVRSLAFLPGDGGLVSAAEDGKIRIHGTTDLAVSRTLSGHALYVAAAIPSADGRSLLSAGYDRIVRRWDLADGKAVEVARSDSAVNAAAVSADGRLLAIGGEDRGARIFDLSKAGPDGKAPLVATLQGGHGRAVSALAFSPDGRLLASGARDGTIRTWLTEDGAPCSRSPDTTAGEVRDFHFLPDGRLLTASESDRVTPVTKQYFSWLGKLVRLDFDRSFVDNERVIDKIAEALPVTLGLNVLAILISFMIGIPLGIRMAVKRGSAFDRVASVVVFLLWALPSFFAATLLIQWFSSKAHFDIFPSVGLQSPNVKDLSYLQRLGDLGMHLVLPVTTSVYASFAGNSQYMRTSMLDTLSQDYVRTARAKGLSEFVVIYRHALRNSLVTMVTLIGSLLPALIGGSIIVERIFSIRGMGYMGFTAILERDYPVIMAVTTMGAVLTLLGMLISDILYSIVDPRISHS